MMNRPKLFLVGGPNGAGKSTFARPFLAEHPDYVFLNADEIARQLNPDDMHAARFEAGRAFLATLATSRESRANLVVESTLSGVSLAQQIRLFADTGYYIGLTYVFLSSPELSVSRVAGRVLEGGHHVPTADILRRVGRSQQNFWHSYRLLANEWQLVYNADTGFPFVAKFAQRNLTVLNRPVFRLFLGDTDFASVSVPAVQAAAPATEYPQYPGFADEIQRSGQEAVLEAQAGLRRQGIPLCFSRNGRIYYEMPDGTIQTENPYPELLRQRGFARPE